MRTFANAEDGNIVSVVVDGERTKRLNREHLDSVFFALLGGNTFSNHRYPSLCIHHCDSSISLCRYSEKSSKVIEKQWYRYQNYLLPAIVRAANNILRNTRKAMAEKGEGWKAQLNGAWSHRGYKAKHHTYMVRDFDSNLCVCAIVLTKDWNKVMTFRDGSTKKVTIPGNYFGTSKGMEPVAFDMALKQLREDNLLTLLTKICGDGDLECAPILDAHDDCKHIKRAYDPGHRQRNLLRALLDVCGQTPFWKGIAYRMGKFMMRCVKRAESESPGDTDHHLQLRKEYFLNLWRHCWPHYTRQECPRECPCNQWLQADNVSRDQQELMDTVANLMDGNNYEVIHEEVHLNLSIYSPANCGRLRVMETLLLILV